MGTGFSACTPCVLCTDRTKGGLLLLGTKARKRSALMRASPCCTERTARTAHCRGCWNWREFPSSAAGRWQAHSAWTRRGRIGLPLLQAFHAHAVLSFAAQILRKASHTQAELIGFPLFVKPVRSGSSFGVSRVTDPKDLAAAVRTAFTPSMRKFCSRKRCRGLKSDAPWSEMTSS